MSVGAWAKSGRPHGAPNTAVILSGGAAYGAYEVGVMLALFRGESPATAGRAINVNLFSGTSVGSFNAAAMAANTRRGLAEAAEWLSHVWLDQIAQKPGQCRNGVFHVRGMGAADLRCLLRPGAPADVLRDGAYFLRQFFPRSARFAGMARTLSPDALTRALLEQLDVTAFIDMSPFRALLRRCIPLDELRAADVGLRVVTTNFDTGELAVFDSHDIADKVGHDAIQASAAVPGFFPPVSIGGQLHIDGGALMNTPLIPATYGNEILHVVYMDAPVGTIAIENLRSTLGVVDRMLVTNFAFSMNQDIELIADVNHTLTLIEGGDPDPAAGPLSPELARAGAGLKDYLARADHGYAVSTIHRYHPGEDLGGSLGFLDFTVEHIDALLERGYRDAATHDCAASGCLIPGSLTGGRA